MANNLQGGMLDDQGKMNNFAIEPPIVVEADERVGFTKYAEKFNGRAAMIGFASLLLLEVFTGHGVIGIFQ
ncbi:MAG: high light inducible protein [Limnothrix sp. RL_2_0]|nr:high light inducible protein [Limnothrix sp. RL_2_0]